MANRYYSKYLVVYRSIYILYQVFSSIEQYLYTTQNEGEIMARKNIYISDETYERLLRRKNHPRETFDNVIQEMLNNGTK